MPHAFQIIDDICLTRYNGVLDKECILNARAERREKGFLRIFRKFILDYSPIDQFDVQFSLHKQLAVEDSSRLGMTMRDSTFQGLSVAHVIERERWPALYGDVRAWQSLVAPEGIITEIHQTLEFAMAWIRRT